MEILEQLEQRIGERRKKMPKGSYTTELFNSGVQRIRQKVGEEAVEVILAEKKERIISETGDLLYHLLVLLRDRGISLDEVAAELKRRFDPST